MLALNPCVGRCSKKQDRQDLPGHELVSFMSAGEHKMIRLLAAAMLLAATAVAPAFACELNKTVSTDTKSNTLASQSADDHAPPPSSTPADHTQS